MFHEGGLTADFLEITEILNRIAPHFRGKKVELSSPGGTNLVCSVEGREPVIDYGRSIRPGQSSSPPNAEIALGPVEGTAQGVLVIDGSIPHPSLNMIREPITMHVEDGQIVMISGTNEADTVRRILEQYKDSRVYNIGEVGLPVNRENKICGRMLADEGAYGTVHIGIGNNLSFGGNVEAPLHMDMVIRDITLKIDGRIISQNGILQI
jgi:leucyl aminopeptidase (aminopeptidase T)